MCFDFSWQTTNRVTFTLLSQMQPDVHFPLLFWVRVRFSSVGLLCVSCVSCLDDIPLVRGRTVQRSSQYGFDIFPLGASSTLSVPITARPSTVAAISPRLHQQQCRSNIVERYKLNDSFDSVECCFDILAVFGNNVAGFCNNVERNFVLSTKTKQIEHVQFVSTLSKRRNFVRHCCRLWQQSRMLLRQCCWCGRGHTVTCVALSE